MAGSRPDDRADAAPCGAASVSTLGAGPRGWPARAQGVAPGLLLCAVIALSATFVSEHYGGPQLLYALLVGLSFHFLSGDERFRTGLDVCSRTLLRAGVALLGFRITFEQIGALGWATAGLVLLGVGTTIGLGLLLARALRRPPEEGVLSGCAVGICGASAALAVSSVLPATRENERFTLLTVVGVTLMSTLAMVVYPVLAGVLGMSGSQAGVFFGATIHDVAQVVAAGMIVAQGAHAAPGTAGVVEAATVVKLFRVMLLMPVMLLVALAWRRRAKQRHAAPPAARPVPAVPGFLLAFAGFVLLGSLATVPPEVGSVAGDLSRALLVLAIAAAGVKTSFADLMRLGWKPVALLLVETLWIALVAGLGLMLIGFTAAYS